MTSHSTAELLGDESLFAQVDAQCATWKRSQKSPLTFPAVVITTCNNLDAAKARKAADREIEKLRREAS